MKGLIIITLFFFLAVICYSQTVLFQKIYGGNEQDLGQSVRQTSDGGYVLAGFSDSFGAGPNADFYIIKINNIGDTIWTKTYGTIEEDRAYDIQQTMDGGYVLTGYSDNASSYSNVILFKLNSNGNLQWNKTYTCSNYEIGYTVQETNDGGFIIGGRVSVISPFGYNVYLVKADSNGDTLWTKQYGTNTEGYCAQQTSDGGYIITGNSYGSSTLLDAYLVKTNSNGDTLWTKTYGGTKDDQGNFVQQTSDGGYIITGYTYSFDTLKQVYLIRTDSNGDTLWSKKINALNSAWTGGKAVQETTDGGFIVAGSFANLINQSNDCILIKTNSNGDTLWTKTYGGTNGDYFESVQQTTDGGYVMVGRTDSYGIPPYNNVYLVKTDSLGNTSGPPVGVWEQQEAEAVAGEIAIYPNPFTEQANLVLPNEIETNGEAELVIYDVLGNETARVKITAQRALIQRDNSKAGLYFCKVVKENTVVATGKFIIQ